MLDGERALRSLNPKAPAVTAGPAPKPRRPAVEVHHFDCEPQDCVPACPLFGKQAGGKA